MTTPEQAAAEYATDGETETETEAAPADGGDDKKGLAALGLAAVTPLVTASESGPTAEWFEARGVDTRTANLLDGVTDYLGAFVPVPDESLGPAGKILAAIAGDDAPDGDGDGDDDDTNGVVVHSDG